MSTELPDIEVQDHFGELTEEVSRICEELASALVLATTLQAMISVPRGEVTTRGLSLILCTADELHDALDEVAESAWSPSFCDLLTDDLIEQALSEVLRGDFAGWAELPLPPTRSYESIWDVLVDKGLATYDEQAGRWESKLIDHDDLALLFTGWHQLPGDEENETDEETGQ